MSIGEFKQLAYILPVFPALDLLAAVGLVVIAGSVGRRRFMGTTAVLTLFLAAQALLVLPYHPYFGVHYNKLLGGTETAKEIFHIQDQGEGLALAAAYLNQLPHAQAASAAVSARNGRTFKRAYNAQTTYTTPTEADFRIYDVHNLQRGLYAEERNWMTMKAYDRQGEPLFTVVFNDVAYVEVYGEIPEPPLANGVAFTPAVRFGDHVRLAKSALSDDVASPGETLTIVHYWQSDGEATRDYKVFNHLLGEDGTPVAQRDDFPLDGIRPLYTWTAGEQMEDVYTIKIPADVAPGAYRLGVGFYDPETFTRLPAFTAGGERLSNDTAVIGDVTITLPDRECDHCK
jgi:hypothetical protein